MIDGFRFFPITQFFNEMMMIDQLIICIFVDGMVVLICGLGIKMMMDQLIRGPGFMPPQAKPPMALNLTDPSPNSSSKVQKQIDYYFRILRWILIHGFSHVMQAIGAVFALATVSIPTMYAFRRLATSMDKFSKVASEEVPGTLSSLKLSGSVPWIQWIIYHGTLPDGQEVAVKVGSATSTQGIREFENELNLLSAIRHENLVPLLGYYCENDQQILVYPFMSNSSLQDCLYGEASKKKVLDWPTRISIALGLFYLHTFAGRGIIHRDVKSSNILLDHSMYAKVAEKRRKRKAETEKASFVDWFHEMCSYQFVVLLIGCRTLRIS
ncbi:hypothetical protein Sjap_013253 [Stephania japonica]|uniref:Protein kinase domain-containing protein n=1 Tax=Stephania japonica TaxID=461633 RepID=A0AAP0IXK7_9MAGN